MQIKKTYDDPVVWISMTFVKVKVVAAVFSADIGTALFSKTAALIVGNTLLIIELPLISALTVLLPPKCELPAKLTLRSALDAPVFRIKGFRW